MTSKIFQQYRADIIDLASRHGAKNVRVFGSLVRGEGNERSDLDLLVTLAEGCSLLDLVGLKQDVEDLIHRPVDVVSERALKLSRCEPGSTCGTCSMPIMKMDDHFDTFLIFPEYPGKSMRLSE